MIDERLYYGLGRLYYTAIHQYVKVGFSENLKQRMAQIRTDNPYEPELLYVEPGDRILEDYRHSQLSHAKHRGEWFYRAETEALIERLKNEEQMVA